MVNLLRMRLFPSQEPESFDAIFVGGVPRGTTEPELRAAFAIAGTDVGDIDLVLDRVTGLQRGFAFVGLLVRVDRLTDGLFLRQLRSAALGGRVLDVQGVPAPRRLRWAPAARQGASSRVCGGRRPRSTTASKVPQPL